MINQLGNGNETLAITDANAPKQQFEYIIQLMKKTSFLQNTLYSEANQLIDNWIKRLSDYTDEQMNENDSKKFNNDINILNGLFENYVSLY